MIKGTIRIIGILSILFFLSGFKNNRSDIDSIERYKIKLSKELIEASNGFYPGIGSSIEFHKKNEDGTIEFFAISDRGPNFPYEKNDDKIISFFPDYHPKIVKILLNRKKLQAGILEFKEMHFNNELVSGLNTAQNNDQDEIIYDPRLKPIKPTFGLDTESISILKNQDLVVGDEYYPSINIIDYKTGAIKKRFVPKEGLPEIFRCRNFNRGFEALTVTPNGKIYAMLEGVLNIDEEIRKNAKFIRMIEIDLETNMTRTFAYMFEQDKYKDSSAVKIGDMTALNNDTLLLIEQGKTLEGDYRNVIYKVSLKNATDIAGLTHDRPLEGLSLEEMRNVKFLKKSLFLDLNKFGWTERKAEGLTIIDTKTIAITNDNDFGIVGYSIDASECKNEVKDNCKKIIPEIDHNKLETDLWIIKFQNRL